MTKRFALAFVVALAFIVAIISRVHRHGKHAGIVAASAPVSLRRAEGANARAAGADSLKALPSAKAPTLREPAPLPKADSTPWRPSEYTVQPSDPGVLVVRSRGGKVVYALEQQLLVIPCPQNIGTCVGFPNGQAVEMDQTLLAKLPLAFRYESIRANETAPPPARRMFTAQGRR